MMSSPLLPITDSHPITPKTRKVKSALQDDNYRPRDPQRGTLGEETPVHNSPLPQTSRAVPCSGEQERRGEGGGSEEEQKGPWMHSAPETLPPAPKPACL